MILSSKEITIGTTPTLHSKGTSQDNQSAAKILCNMLNTAKTDTQESGNPKQKDSDS